MDINGYARPGSYGVFRMVTLALGVGAEPGKTVTVSYDPDKVPNGPPEPGYPEGLGTGPCNTVDLTLVPAFSGVSVTIIVPNPIVPNPATRTLSVSFKVTGKTVELSWTFPAQPAGVSVIPPWKYYTAQTEPGVTEVPDFRP